MWTISKNTMSSQRNRSNITTRAENHASRYTPLECEIEPVLSAGSGRWGDVALAFEDVVSAVVNGGIDPSAHCSSSYGEV